MKGLLVGNIFSLPPYWKKLLHKRKCSLVDDVHLREKKRQKAPDQQVEDSTSKTSPVELHGNKAIARLAPGQMVTLDGCAMVCLLEGSGSMLGYSLKRDTEMLVYSSSGLCSGLTFVASDRRGCTLEFGSYKLNHLNDDSLSFTLEHFEVPTLELQTPGISIGLSNGARKRKLDDMPNTGRRVRPTIVPSDWLLTADTVMSDSNLCPVVPICGAKGTGKSTFGRFLVNRLLSRYEAVAYLDTDVGQPEFTIPGCLSLHILREPIIGSPVSHLRLPERCFFYGDTTPKSDPAMYLKCFMDLYDYLQQLDIPHVGQNNASSFKIPLVINTPGWLKGVGYELLLHILRYSAPTHVVDIESGQSDILSGVCAAPVLHLKSILSYCPRGGAKSPAQLRSLRVLSYFRRCVSEDTFAELPLNGFANSLAFQIPYQVSADDMKIKHLFVEVPASQSLYCLNAQLVGLGVSTLVEGKRVPCLGFGIVRGVDTVKRILYMLTPSPSDILEKVDTILHGRVEIPVSLLEVEGGFVCPYLCRNHVLEGIGSSVLRRRVRR